MPLPDRKEVGTLYYEYGKDKNKHVLFIHGLGSSSIAWRDIPQALSEHFHTITVDLIGFGGSDKPNTADYTIKGFSKFIVDFLRERIRIKENEKISIVGHSLGGYIAAEVAIENQQIIQSKDLANSLLIFSEKELE
jgi:pimeloyl-ACP methyl ester carboxylesterase